MPKLIISGLNDHEMPAIIAAAVDHGAMRAGYTMVRLPYALKDLFIDWLHLHFPDRAEKVLNAIREVRNGQLYDSQWGTRMSGAGERAEAIARFFEVCYNKHDLNRTSTPLTTEHFRRSPAQQIDLFAA